MAAAEQANPTENADETEEEETYAYKCGECEKDCDQKKIYINRIPPWNEAPLDLGNDPKKLRKNYSTYLENARNANDSEVITWTAKCFMASDKNFAETVQNKEDAGEIQKFKFQAHHLISGNQAFQKKVGGAVKPDYEYILRMAHVCDYDINNAQNCIMLVSDSEGEDNTSHLIPAEGTISQKESEKSEKSLIAYKTMNASKIQWHVGPHSYSFRQETVNAIISRIEFYTKKNVKLKKSSQGTTLKSYIDLLRDELEKIESRIQRKMDAGEKICPQNFRTQMDKLSARIRKPLEDFAEGFHLSYPWYVSKESFLFAFQLPQSFRIITAERKGQTIRLQRFNISRKMDDTITVKPSATIKGETAIEYQLDRIQESRIKIVNFCSNIEYFIFFGECGPSELPFKIDSQNARMEENEKNPTQLYLEKHAYNILNWLKDLQKHEYRSPVECIKARLAANPGQCKEV